MKASDLEPLLAEAGLAPQDCQVLDTLVRPGGRTLLRLSAPNGELLKVRSFSNRENAEAMVGLRGLIGEHRGFSCIKAHWGPHVLEEWVEGPCLAQINVSPAQARACGALLAGLHQIALPADGAEVMEVSPLTEESLTRLQTLAAAGALTPPEATRLSNTLQVRAPRLARRGVIHFDFCGENLVWAEGRAAVSIDNERLRVGPLAYDLGRTMARWPLPAPSLEAVLAGYSAAGGPAEAGERPFWGLVALISSAWFRVCHDPATADLPLQTLRAWVPSSEEVIA